MTRYLYTAIDKDGQAVRGALETAGPEQALAQLAAQGLRVEAAGLRAAGESVPAGGRLSAEEAAQLGMQVADLARDSLPLEPGLQALAEELPHRRLGSVLRRIAERLDQGGSLESALALEQARLPEHLRGLVVAGIRSGRLGEVLEELVLIDQRRRHLRQNITLALAYPALLLAMIVGVFAFLGIAVAPHFAEIYRDFNTELPPMTQLFLTTCSPASGAAALVILIVFVVSIVVLWGLRPVSAWTQTVLYAIPVIGPLWRSHNLAEFSRMMELLLAIELPLPGALRLTADGLQAAGLSAACRRAASRVDGGLSLAEAMAGSPAFPRRLQALAGQGERTATLGESFRAAAEMFEGLAATQRTFFEAILLPLLLLTIVSYVGFVLLALLLPLISLVSRLSG
jgi:general secretion pathway protein F